MQALEDEKNHNLALYAGRYQLFVAWSPDRSHPWDALPAAEQAAAVLEVGGARDGSGKVVPPTSVKSTAVWRNGGCTLNGSGRVMLICLLSAAMPTAWLPASCHAGERSGAEGQQRHWRQRQGPPCVDFYLSAVRRIALCRTQASSATVCSPSLRLFFACTQVTLLLNGQPPGRTSFASSTLTTPRTIEPASAWQASASSLSHCAQVVLLLDGRPLGRTTFAGGMLRTAKPVPWALPGGSGTADVQLTLAFGAALGYGRYKGAPAIAYVGPQANGARLPAVPERVLGTLSLAEPVLGNSDAPE